MNENFESGNHFKPDNEEYTEEGLGPNIYDGFDFGAEVGSFGQKLVGSLRDFLFEPPEEYGPKTLVEAGQNFNREKARYDMESMRAKIMEKLQSLDAFDGLQSEEVRQKVVDTIKDIEGLIDKVKIYYRTEYMADRYDEMQMRVMETLEERTARRKEAIKELYSEFKVVLKSLFFVQKRGFINALREVLLETDEVAVTEMSTEGRKERHIEIYQALKNELEQKFGIMEQQLSDSLEKTTTEV